MESNISQWPLSRDGIRFIVPKFRIAELAGNPITRGCYPVALGYYPQASGHRMTRDLHHDNLLIYCTAGIGHALIDGAPYTVSAGDVIVLPKGLAHSYSADRHRPWSIYWVHFSGWLCDEFLNALGLSSERANVFRAGTKAKLTTDFEFLLDIRNTGYNPKNFVLAANILRQILSYLSVAKSGHMSSRGNDFDIDRIHAVMQEHLNGQLDLDTLASKVNLSKYHFSNKYRTVTGQSPIQHFLHLKMERACFLLDISGNSIKGIGASLGYEDTYYFSRLFKKIIGVSPTEYRKLQRG